MVVGGMALLLCVLGRQEYGSRATSGRGESEDDCLDGVGRATPVFVHFVPQS